MDDFIIKFLIAVAIWIPLCTLFGYLAIKHKDYAYTYGITAMGIMNIIVAYMFK